MRAAAAALTAFEIAVGGRGAAFAAAPACRRSSPGTWSSPARAIRNRRRGRSHRDLLLRPVPSQGRSRARPSRRHGRRPSCPWRCAAAARKSSMRPLVQEPMKTRSIFTSLSAVRRVSDPYRRARVRRPRAVFASAIAAGSGTVAVMGSACSGEVPQVTIGTMSARIERDLDVELRVVVGFQRLPVHARLLRTRRPWARADCPRHRRTSFRPARSGRRARRASIVMLQRVMRPSIESARTASPAYSMT